MVSPGKDPETNNPYKISMDAFVGLGKMMKGQNDGELA